MENGVRSGNPFIILTHFPSPYQVELFNEIERQRPGAARVLYLFRRDPGRAWGHTTMAHAFQYIDRDQDTLAAAHAAVVEAPFVVFNYYNDSRAAALIRARSMAGAPWCFWGEPPGYRFGWVTRLLRLVRLGTLYPSVQPIWGIGTWAVAAYRKEFGDARPYLNVPYYSDLSRFRTVNPAFSSTRFTFLFSGALSRRKGVDTLALAFRRLAAEFPHVHLKIMGAGELEASMRSVLAGVDRVHWVGFKDWQDLPAEYGTAQVLCVPSRHDGWGLVVPEGLASALPIIGTDRTGAALDLIAPGSNGWLISAGDQEALYRAMREAATLTESRWVAMSRAAREGVAGHTLEAGAARFIGGVDDALRGRFH